MSLLQRLGMMSGGGLFYSLVSNYDTAKFNGSSSRITFGATAGNFNTSDFSVSFWIRRNVGSVRQYAVTKQKTASSFEGYYIQIDTSNRLQMYILYPDGTNHNVLSAALASAVFHHIAISLDRDGNMVLYVNGAAVATTDISSKSAQDIDSTGILTVGRRSQGLDDLHLNADFTDFQMFDVAITASESTELYNNGDVLDYSLMSSNLSTNTHLSIDLNSNDTTAEDRGANSYDGTATSVTYDGESIGWEE